MALIHLFLPVIIKCLPRLLSTLRVGSHYGSCTRYYIDLGAIIARPFNSSPRNTVNPAVAQTGGPVRSKRTFMACTECRRRQVCGVLLLLRCLDLVLTVLPQVKVCRR
jgi:hypothetical protein